jgi:hypothetical protein
MTQLGCRQTSRPFQTIHHGQYTDIEREADRRMESTQVEDGKRTAVNWILAILTAPAALAVVVYSYLQVLGSAGCSGGTCAKVGPGETVFGLIEYGTPVVAVVAVALSFVTASRRYGIAVPAIALAIIAAAAIVLFTTF